MRVKFSQFSTVMNVLRLFAILFLAAQAAALAIGGRLMHIERESDGLQDVVSIFES